MKDGPGARYGEEAPHTRRGALLAIVLASVVLCSQGTESAAAANWSVHVAANSSGASQAQALPAAPTGVAAACAAPTTSKTIKVSWNAVTLATSYSVYESTSAAGTYSLVASGVSTTSWTSGTLTASKNYWYEVAAVIGSNWTGAKSSASGESSIKSSSPYCVQP